MTLSNDASLRRSTAKTQNKEQVKDLQTLLKDLGYYTRSIDGDFGYYTEQAVKSFQKQYSLTVDGWAGPITCKKLNEVTKAREEAKKVINTIDLTNLKLNCNEISLKEGSTDITNVVKLQTILKELGYYTRQVDGEFGPYTTEAVKAFQKATNHDPDGWFGPKTCPDLNKKYEEKKKKDELKVTGKIYEDLKNPTTQRLSYKIKTLKEIAQKVTQPTTTTTATESKEGETTETSTSENSEDHKDKASAENLKEIEFNDINTINITQDNDGLSYDGSFETPYSVDKLNAMRRFQKIEIHCYKNDKEYYCHKGYISDIKIAQKDTYLALTVNVTSYSSFLNEQIEYNGTAKKSEHIKKICEKVGLKAEVNTAGLKDDDYTMKVQETKTDGTTSTTDSGGTGDGSMTRAEIFEIAKKWGYGGFSTSDPQTAYNAYKNGTRSFDCYGASACLYYMFSKFTKVGVQVMHYHSSYSRSGTHRTIQLKENGQWINPPEYKQMTRMLRVIDSETKTTLTYNGVIMSTDNKVVTNK